MNQPVLLRDRTPTAPPAPRATRKVLHLINGEHYSGAERVQDLLSSSLPDFGFQVGFACFKPGKFPDQRQDQSSELHCLKMKSKFDIRAVSHIQRLVEQEKFELLHAHTPRTVLIGGLVSRRTGMPLVYHVHSPVGRDSTRWFHNRINQWVETWSARRVDHFICVSNSLERYMVSLGHDRNRISTVQNGVRIVNVPNRARPTRRWTLGTTALFRPRKGIEVLLQAISILNQQGTPVELLAVGPFESPEYEKTIRGLARQLQVDHLITWTGFTHDVNQQIRKMDLFVLPSLFGEGLPMVILEAMANGVPVIAAKVEGVTEAIRHEIDGLIFEPGKACSLADQISNMVAGRYDWQALRESSLSRQRESFSDTSMARGVAAVYSWVLTHR